MQQIKNISRSAFRSVLQCFSFELILPRFFTPLYFNAICVKLKNGNDGFKMCIDKL